MVRIPVLAHRVISLHCNGPSAFGATADIDGAGGEWVVIAAPGFIEPCLPTVDARPNGALWLHARRDFVLSLRGSARGAYVLGQ